MATCDAQLVEEDWRSHVNAVILSVLVLALDVAATSATFIKVGLRARVLGASYLQGFDNFFLRQAFCTAINNMMAATRVRKAFKYPVEDDSEPEEIDEEHQEQLISDIQAEDAQRSELYRKAFLTIPLTGLLFFIYTFVFEARTAHQRLLALLSLSSLTSTAYIHHFMPLQAPERKGKKPIYKIDAEKGPVDKYLVYLNTALAGLLLLAAAVSWSKGEGEDAWREALPAIIFGMTMFARQQLAPLDLEELQKAKYDYKGA